MVAVVPSLESRFSEAERERRSALDSIKLTTLRAQTLGDPGIRVGLIDGPVALEHDGLQRGRLEQIGAPASSNSSCADAESLACLHGTFVAGILAGRPDGIAPGICPECTLLIRPVFSEAIVGRDGMPTATPADLATAIFACLEAKVHIINLSLGLTAPSSKGELVLQQALDEALRRGTIVAAAAGNQGTLGTSVITRHPWVIPVVASDLRGRPIADSNLGGSLGRRGLSAPGDRITSLSPDGDSIRLSGTSVAVPFVTGAIALLWSAFPSATPVQIKLAVLGATGQRRSSVIPPLLDAAAAWVRLGASRARRQIA